MAVDGKNRHYLWDSILYRQWQEIARKTGLSSAVFDASIQQLLNSTSSVIDIVTALIPKGFPDAVANRILDGLRSASAGLSAQIP